MSELKKCPFCGGEAKLYNYDGRIPYKRRFYKVRCRCGIKQSQKSFSTKQHAIDAWNRRADGWISVDEQLPKVEKPVLVVQSSGAMAVAYIEFESGHWCDSTYNKLQDPIHWQPLPEPPKESEGTDGA